MVYRVTHPRIEDGERTEQNRSFRSTNETVMTRYKFRFVLLTYLMESPVEGDDV